MNSLDIGAISVTSAFLAICLGYVLKEFIESLRSSKDFLTTVDLDRCNLSKESLTRRIYRLLLLNVGFNNLVLVALLILVSGLICSISKNYKNTICFLVGSFTTVLIGLISMTVCRRTSSKLVNLSYRGLRHVYRRCLGNSSAIVVLSLSLGLISQFALTLAFTVTGEAQSGDVESLTKTLSFFAFGSLFVNSFSRLSVGNFSNSFNILLDCNLEDREEEFAIFENMNNYFQNVYELSLEVVAVTSTLFCTYFMVMGQYTSEGEALGARFGYLNFPLLILSFSMFVTVFFVWAFSLFMRNNSFSLVKKSYLFSVFCSLFVIAGFLPLFFVFFTPETVTEVKYSPFLNYALFVIGMGSGVFLALFTYYFSSKGNFPGKSVTLSTMSSPSAGILNALSFSKLLCFVTTLLVCFDLLVCFLFSGLYGILFLSMGFMCSLTAVLTGSVFFSLVFTSYNLAEYSGDTCEVKEILKSFTSYWYEINSVTSPFLSTLSILIGLLLLTHLSKDLGVKFSKKFNPFLLVSVLLGCFFPVFQSGLILRISSGIANMRLKKTNIFGVFSGLFPRKDPDPNEDSDRKNRRRSIFKKFKNKKNEDFEAENVNEVPEDLNEPESHQEDSQAQEQSQPQENFENFDNDQLINYRVNLEAQENGENNVTGPEDVVIEVRNGEEAEEELKRFRGGFRACLLKEAGVKEESLLNAPITCSSGRSTHQDFLINRKVDNYYISSENEEYTTKTIYSENIENAEHQNGENYRHTSRDYKILKNADNHYKMFHPKYHVKHFNLRKRSTIASGSLEDLSLLLPKNENSHSDQPETIDPSQDKNTKNQNLYEIVRKTQDSENQNFAQLYTRHESCSSCSSSYRETEASSLLKDLQSYQVHSRPLENDGEMGAKSSGEFLNTPKTDIDPNEGDLSFESEKDSSNKESGFRSRRGSKEGKFKKKEKVKKEKGPKPLKAPKGAKGSKDKLIEELDSQSDEDPQKSKELMNELSRKSRDSSESKEESQLPPQSEQSFDINIKVKQALLPPDVDISNQPRRPTPKSIDLSELRDLESGLPQEQTLKSGRSILETAKSSPYQNAFQSFLLSLIPLAFSLGFPFLVGLSLGKNSVLVSLLFSTVSSSFMVQVVTLCSICWNSSQKLLRESSKSNSTSNTSNEERPNNQSLLRVASTSLVPVLNALVLILPLVCILASDVLEKYSNEDGFPSWSSYTG